MDADQLPTARIALSYACDSVETKMSSEPIQPNHDDSLELPVEELLRRARPLPPHEEMVIDDLTSEEGDAFLAALRQ